MWHSMEMGQPIIFFCSEIFGLFPLIAPCRPIRILDWQVAQRIWQSLRKSVIQAQQFTVKNVIRPPVRHNVMKYSYHYIVIVGDPHQRDAGKRPLLQIKRLPDEARDYLMSRSFWIRLTAHVDHRSGKLYICDKLEWFAVNGFEDRAQYLVALRHHVQASFKQRHIKLSFYAKAISDVVCRCVWLKLLDKP